MRLFQLTRLLIDRAVLERLTLSSPPYVYEILIEAELFLSWEREVGFILEIQPKTRNQLLIFLQVESVTAVLKATTQLFHPDVLRLRHQELSRDIPVKDFLSFCD